MHKIRKVYERVVLWLINQLATTIVRPADIGLVELLNLKPFMHIIRGENGVRHIGIYCDPVWKSLNGFPDMGTPEEVRIQVKSVAAPAKPTKKTRRKAVKR